MNNVTNNLHPCKWFTTAQLNLHIEYVKSDLIKRFENCSAPIDCIDIIEEAKGFGHIELAEEFIEQLSESTNKSVKFTKAFIASYNGCNHREPEEQPDYEVKLIAQKP